jgi:hypothetical protein
MKKQEMVSNETKKITVERTIILLGLFNKPYPT